MTECPLTAVATAFDLISDQVEWNMLCRFLLDGVGQFLIAHRGQRDFLHDDGVSAYRCGHRLRFDLRSSRMEYVVPLPSGWCRPVPDRSSRAARFSSR